MPPAPSEFHITTASDQSVDLSWRSAGGTTAGYQLAYIPGTTPPTDCETGTVLTVGPGSIRSLHVTGLNPGTRYAGRLCARNTNSTLSSGVTLSFGTTGYCSAYSSATHYSEIGGDGSPENPFLICTRAQFASIRSDCNSSRFTACEDSFLLMDNIDFGGETLNPIGNCCSAKGSYLGQFDGGSYAVSNYVVSGQWAGFFKYIGLTGRVKNLRIVNVTASGQNAAALAGRSDGTISDVVVQGLTSLPTNSEAGGLVSSNYGTISRVTVTGLDMRATGSATRLGGLIARNYGTLIDSSIEGAFTATTNAGQESGTVVGSNDSSGVIHHVRSAVSSIHDGGPNTFGGFAGTNAGTITLSRYEGTISILGPWKQSVGGFVGQNRGQVERCSASGALKGGSSQGGMQLGGFVGLNSGNGEIRDSYTRMTVASGQYGSAGGFAGTNQGTLTSAYSTGTATVASGTAGGFFGSSTHGTVSACFWDQTSSALSTATPNGVATGVTAMTTSEMQNASNFETMGWDFETTWELAPGSYPTLIGAP